MALSFMWYKNENLDFIVTDREQKFDTAIPFLAVNMRSSGDSESFPSEVSAINL